MEAALLGRPGHPLRRSSRNAADTGTQRPIRSRAESAASTRTWRFPARPSTC